MWAAQNEIPTASMRSERAPNPGQAKYWFIVTYVALLMYSPPMFREWESVNRGVRLDQLLLLLSIFALILVRPNRTAAALRNPVGGALSVFTVASVVSAFAAAAFVPGASLVGALVITWGQSRSVLAFVLTFVVLRDAPESMRRRIGRVFLLLGAGVATIAALQSAGVEWINEMSLAHYSRKDSVDIGLALEAGRAFGTFDGQPNILGTFCVLALGLALSEHVRVSTVWRWLTIAACGLFAWALAASWSRGAYAGAVVGAVVLLLQVRPRAALRIAIIAVGIGALVYISAPVSVQTRFQQLLTNTGGERGDSMFTSREVSWADSLRVVARHPWFGARGVAINPPDSLYVALVMYNGVIGAILFLFALLVALRELARSTSVCGRYFAQPMIAVTIAWLVNGVSVGTFFGERVQEMYWMFVAVALATPRSFPAANLQNRVRLDSTRAAVK